MRVRHSEGNESHVPALSRRSRTAPPDHEDAGALVQKAEATLQHAKATGEPHLHYKREMRSEIKGSVAPIGWLPDRI